MNGLGKQELLNISDDVFKTVIRTPLYFGPDNKKLIGWLHVPESSQYLDCCVVICPPLAVEYMSTYRSLRYVADYFALAGIPSFRFDYHGTGDSSGLNDEGNRLDAWLWSIEQACLEAKRLTGCSKVGLFGLRMGATLAALVSEKQEVEFLVLWAALDSGRKFIRETRAIQMTGTSQTGGGAPEFVEAGGIVYWPQTVDAIGKINLINIVPKTSRILIVPRDDLQSNTKLVETWSTQGRNVKQIEYPGSSDMLLIALDSVVPHKSIVNIVDWVRQGVNDSKIECPDIIDLKVTTSAIVASLPELNVKESFISFGPQNDYFAILTEPTRLTNSELPVVIIANSGATHRVGPSRLYVTLARELAHLGFHCLRIDIPGLGDSIIYDRAQENKDYIELSSDVIRQALESFGSDYQERKYVITGLCSGAYFSFHAALDLDDIGIVESILINPLTFYWHEGIELESSPIQNFGYWNWYKQAIKNPKSWVKFLKGGTNYSALYETLKNRIKIVVSAKMKSHVKQSNSVVSGEVVNDLNIDLMTVASNGTHLSLILARSDPGYDILMTSAGKIARKLIEEGKVDIHMVEDADHTFSKYKPRCDAINAIVNHIVTRYRKE